MSFVKGELVLDETGLTYKGKKVEDAGEAYKIWMKVLDIPTAKELEFKKKIEEIERETAEPVWVVHFY